LKAEPAHTWKLGLIGYPLGHSVSPVLHKAALLAAGLTGDYRLYTVPPTDEGNLMMQELSTCLRSGTLDGLNITIPHKQTIMKYVDRLTDTARAVGAVNTIYRGDDGLLTGENTDVPGFLKDLERILSLDSGKAVVLGAGGSARAVVYALLRTGWQVTVLARKTEQAEMLVNQVMMAGISHEQVVSGKLEDQALEQIGKEVSLMVNTTPLGMHPHPETCPWPEDLALPPRAAVYDLVYNPLETSLIRRAREQGLAAATGAGMLTAQAALAFGIWTGLEPPFMVMDQAFPRELSTKQ
jgi:shikimate dehydrogenase